MEESGDINLEEQITLMRSLVLTTGGLHAWHLAQLKYYLAFALDQQFNKATIGYDNEEHLITFYVSLKKGQKLPRKKEFVQKCDIIDSWTKQLFWDTMKIEIIRGKKSIYSSK